MYAGHLISIRAALYYGLLVVKKSLFAPQRRSLKPHLGTLVKACRITTWVEKSSPIARTTGNVTGLGYIS